MRLEHNWRKLVYFTSFAIAFCPLLFCSCATQNPNHPPLPPETNLNPKAGCGDWIVVKLHLEDGEELPFVLDTGAPVTILDKSLESKLGERLGTRIRTYGYLGKKRMGLYHAPKLFLEGVPLQSGSRVYTDDLASMAKNSFMGILGVDCLQNYCIQFDFASRKMRFLNPDEMNDNDWGKAFPLTILFGTVFAYADFFGAGNVHFRPDTGAIPENDAVLSRKLFQRELKKQTLIQTWEASTNGPDMAAFSKGIFGGQTYTNLLFMEAKGLAWEDQDMLNLQFLARHLVTFNFPKRKMYLKQQSVGPLFSQYFIEAEAEQFLVALERKGRLPGLNHDPQGDFFVSKDSGFETYPFSITFDFRKKGVASVYHYSLIQESKNQSWKLQKTWQTDSNGKTLEEYPIL